MNFNAKSVHTSRKKLLFWKNNKKIFEEKVKNIFFAQCHLKHIHFQFENEMRNSFLSFYKLNFYTHSHVFIFFSYIQNECICYIWKFRYLFLFVVFFCHWMFYIFLPLTQLLTFAKVIFGKRFLYTFFFNVMLFIHKQNKATINIWFVHIYINERKTKN